MMVFEDAVINDTMSGDAAFLYTYGLFLANGGTYNQFMDMDWDDVQLMYYAQEITRRKTVKETIEGVARLFGDPDGGL